MTQAPEAFKQYRQFIIYKVVPSTSRPSKTDKFPVDHLTGQVSNAHDPSIWTDYATAEAAATAWGEGWGVGFVFTQFDPFFFLDVDNCLQASGQWSPLALSLCQMLAGAAIEVSGSGTGLHIFGTGVCPPHKSRNAAYGLEFYTEGRFAALTGAGAMGDAGFDASAVLPTLVETYFAPDAQTPGGESDWTEQPREDWNGPKDDDDLIRRAMSRQSAEAAFGHKASFADLWLADEPKLAAAYPDQGGRTYNASSADAALAQHLAWWTGCDCSRVRRIMERSALVRDKWNREDYLPRTILGAVSRQIEVLQDAEPVDAAKRRQQQIEENLKIGEGSEEHPSSIVLTEDEMLSRYVYVIEGKRVLDLERPRRIFALDEWKSAHRSSMTVVVDKKNYNLDGSNKTKSVETGKLWEMNPNRKQVDSVTFRPGYKHVTVDPEGKTAANSWRPIERFVMPGDASLFLQHLDYLFGVDAPRFLDWLAHIEQRPGELPHTGWVHISPSQGTGRNWLASVLCRLWSGYVASSFNLSETFRTGFNGALSQKLLAIVDEINEGGTDGRWENAETLKSLVTSEHRAINPKYGHQRLEYNACRWLIFSNHTSALPLTERDRRFNIVRNDNPPMLSEYYGKLYGALKDLSFIAGVAEVLRTRDLSNFNPGAHAEMSDAKREMVEASRSYVDEVIAQLVASYPADVIANSMLGEKLTNQIGGKMTAHHKHALERAGVRPYGKSIRLGSDVGKVRILRNHPLWMNATTGQIQAELARASPLWAVSNEISASNFSTL